MANPHHRAILNEGIAAWNHWREANPNIQPDLSEAFGSHPFRGTRMPQNLRGINFHWVDLRRADLYRVDLSNADLRAANLEEADLDGATLLSARCDAAGFIGARMSRVNAIGATFKRASFRRANLAETTLQDAKLEGADLTEAFLWHTNVQSAVLMTAIADATIFAGVDLSNANGLDAIEHKGPSIVDLETIRRSHGKVHRHFLLGCGLSDLEIEITKLQDPSENHVEIMYRIVDLAKTQPIQFYSCFISYSHADKPFAQRLFNALQERGIRCWLDEHQLLPGDDIYEQIDRGIRLWDKVLLCCSQQSLSSWWVDNEIASAFAKEQQLMKERGKKVLVLIPLTLDDHLLSQRTSNAKATQVLQRLAGDFRGWEHDVGKFEKQLGLLIQALRADDGARLAPAPRI